jgi:aspartyl-tRNA synthetase
MSIAGGFERVFELAPTFRAEKSRTSRHATEFTSFDLEFAHVDNVYDVMKVEEAMLTHMLHQVSEKYGNDIERVFGIKVIVPSAPFPVMKLADIYKELEQKYQYTVSEADKGDLNAEGEKLVYQLAKEKFNSEFMFVIGYSASTRPFYHARDNDGVPQGFDLI